MKVQVSFFLAFLSVLSFAASSSSPLSFFSALIIALLWLGRLLKRRALPPQLSYMVAILGFALGFLRASSSFALGFGEMMSFLILAEMIRVENYSARRWSHLACLVLMADTALFLTGPVFALLVLVFTYVSLLSLHAELYPGEPVRIHRFTPFHFLATLLFAPLLFVLVPRSSGAFLAVAPGLPVSGLGEYIDLNFSGRIREISRVVLELRGEKIPALWRARVFNTYRDGRWFWKGRAGLLRLDNIRIESGAARQQVEVVFRDRKMRNLVFPYGTCRVLFSPSTIKAFSGGWYEFLRPLRGYRVELCGSEGLPSFGEQVRVRVKSSIKRELLAFAEKFYEPDPLRCAAKMEAYFRSNFKYSLSVRQVHPDPIYSFLFLTKEGHCELFAGSMALLLNLLGHKARVAAGFRVEATGSPVLVRMRDAHAWVEVFKDGRWYPFDPSPPFIPQGLGLIDRVRQFYQKLTILWSDYVVNFNLVLQSRLLRFFKRNAPQLLAAAVLLFLLLLLLPRIPLKGEKREKKAESRSLPWYYSRLLRIARRAGVEKPSWMTPLEFAGLLGDEAVNVVNFLYRERFGKIKLKPEEESFLRKELRALENKFGRRTGGKA